MPDCFHTFPTMTAPSTPALEAMVFMGTLSAFWMICTPIFWSKFSNLARTSSSVLLQRQRWEVEVGTTCGGYKQKVTGAQGESEKEERSGEWTGGAHHLPPHLACSRAAPPPGTIPSSTAALVALSASTTRSFFSPTSTSLPPPTLMTAIPPESLARRSCSFSLKC